MNRVVLVTGAARNTGLAIIRRFAREGYDAVITSRSADEAREAALQVGREYPAVRVMGLGMDPASVESIRAAFSVVKQEFGHLNAYISNAAHLGVDLSIFNATQADWDAVMNANARGSFFGCQEAVKLMPPGSAICLIGSVHANATLPGRVLYAASKGAIAAMNHALALEVGHLGIRINNLVAGAIHTDRWDHQDEATTKKRRAQYPAGRESFGEEIAAGVYYLCSDEAKTVTGAELTIDSGISCCILPYNKEWNQK